MLLSCVPLRQRIRRLHHRHFFTANGGGGSAQRRLPMVLRYGGGDSVRGDDHEVRQGVMKLAETIGSAGNDDARVPAWASFISAAYSGVGWTRTAGGCRVARLSTTCTVRGTIGLAKQPEAPEGLHLVQRCRFTYMPLGFLTPILLIMQKHKPSIYSCQTLRSSIFKS